MSRFLRFARAEISRSHEGGATTLQGVYWWRRKREWWLRELRMLHGIGKWQRRVKRWL